MKKLLSIVLFLLLAAPASAQIVGSYGFTFGSGSTLLGCTSVILTTRLMP